MNASDISRSALRAGLDQTVLCASLRDFALPLLRDLHASTSGFKFWLKLALGAVIGALESFVRQRCA